MTNKRDSELSVGTTLADGDLIRYVDISDTTMAASGTNKVITAGNAGLVSGSLSRLTAYMAADITGIANGILTAVVFDTTVETVGSDIAINGGDNTIINILTDGIYAISANVAAQSSVLGAAQTTNFSLVVASLAPGDQRGSSDDNGLNAATIPVTSFFAAGTNLSVYGQMYVSSGTWALSSGYATTVQRIV